MRGGKGRKYEGEIVKNMSKKNGKKHEWKGMGNVRGRV